jgi:RimJ/RimL family protein N-acetyltransferase
MLKGEKVLLRALRNDDYTYFFKWLNDPAVLQFIGFHLPVSEMKEKKWVEEYGLKNNPSEVLFVIETLTDSVVVGFCVVGKINHKDSIAELTVIIGDMAYWSKGIGKETSNLLIEYAFDQLNLHRLYTGVYSFNVKSLKMLEGVGFQREGCQRQAVYKNGKYYDVILFGLLKEERIK